jgi:hypothetical protein
LQSADNAGSLLSPDVDTGICTLTKDCDPEDVDYFCTRKERDDKEKNIIVKLRTARAKLSTLAVLL